MNKHIYNYIMKLSKQFHIYYHQFKKDDKISKGLNIESKINDLIEMCACMYFKKEEFNYKDMYILVKTIEFLIRDLYGCGTLAKKQNLILSKMIAELSERIKLQFTV